MVGKPDSIIETHLMAANEKNGFTFLCRLSFHSRHVAYCQQLSKEDFQESCWFVITVMKFKLNESKNLNWILEPPKTVENIALSL